MKTRLFYLPLLLLVLGCFGNEEEDLSSIIEQKANERLVNFEANFRRSCRERIEEAAISRADSLLLIRARKLNKLAGRPPKPRRPGAPPQKELSKALPLRPLFPFEIRFDTLLRDSLYQDSLRLDSLMKQEESIEKFND